MTSPSPLRILSRGSLLARLQVEEALPALRRALPSASLEVGVLETTGDRDLNTPLTDPSVPADFFSRELDQAQREGRADIVVHSAKDLPETLPEGIELAAMLPARDTRDALVVREGADLSLGGVIGTSSPLRTAQIRERYPQAECKSIRGDIGRRLAQMDAGDFDAVIIAACALQRLGLDERIHEWLDYETTPLQGRLAITVPSGRDDLLRALSVLDVRKTSGLVVLAGCPADERLLSDWTREVLREADIILNDRLIPESILHSLGDRAEYVGKKGHSHSTTQAHIHRRILHESEAGKLVVRLHGGEPGVLGHLGETLSYCRSWHLRTEVIPAVSAAQLTAARAQCSLTHRHDGRSIRFLSGHRALEDQPLASLSPDTGYLAVYMGVRDIQAIRDRLREAGWDPDTPVTIGQNLGNTSEKVIYSTLDRCPEEEVQAPAVYLVGPPALAPDYTLFTGTDPRPFLRFGPLIHFPVIDLSPLPLEERAKRLRAGLPKWDGLIFASSRAVAFALEALLADGDLRDLAGKKLLAVGPRTRDALRDAGLCADAAPEGFGGASALAELPGDWQGRYGYITSDKSPVKERQQAVADAGITLDPVVLYENRPADADSLPALPYSRVLFTSSSTVDAYFSRFPAEKSAPRDWLAVGTSTLRALERHHLHGLRIGLQPSILTPTRPPGAFKPQRRGKL